MRIALVNNTLAPPGRGGAEACVVELAKYLNQHHEVIVLSGAATQLDDIPCIQLPLLEPPPPDAHIARKALVHARDLWMRSVHLELRERLAEASVDVVNTHEVQCLSSAAFTAIARLGLPHVHTTHDPNMLCARIGMARHGEFCGGRCLLCRPQRVIRSRAAASRLDALIAPSESLRRMHVEAGVIPAHRAILIRQGVRAGRARVRNPSPSRLRIGFIGRLTRFKGVLTLLRVAHKLPSGWRVLIAGSGELEEHVIAAASRVPQIEYFGYLHGEAKDDFFDRLDLLVMPSEWEEPAPLVVTEAAIRGIPAVVANRGGLPETPHCRVFRAGDHESLMRAIEHFILSGEARRASEALLLEREQFMFSRYAKETELVLTRVASGKPPVQSDVRLSCSAGPALALESFD